MSAPKDPEKYKVWKQRLSTSSRSSEARKQMLVSKEWRQKQSIAKKGKKNSPEHCRHISEAKKGKPLSTEHRRRISEVRRSPNNPLRGRPRSEEVRKKIGEGNKGRIVSEETRRKQSLVRKGRSSWNKGKECSQFRGENNGMWKGGKSFEPYCPRFTFEFKNRVRAFFDYKCVECGSPQNGEKLHVHHVNFNKMACCDGTKPLFVALCRSCHTKTQSPRMYWEQYFTDMINDYYGGKCYLNKDEVILKGVEM